MPFIPVKLENDVLKFRRGEMVRPKEECGYYKIRPWALLLRVNRENEADQKFTIHHEEVPKTGACVKQTWQRTI